LEAGHFVAGRFVAGRFVEGRFVGVPINTLVYFGAPKGIFDVLCTVLYLGVRAGIEPAT
jgi:hypothetical protein